jgi:hypothetical protein
MERIGTALMNAILLAGLSFAGQAQAASCCKEGAACCKSQACCKDNQSCCQKAAACCTDQSCAKHGKK